MPKPSVWFTFFVLGNGLGISDPENRPCVFRHMVRFSIRNFKEKMLKGVDVILFVTLGHNLNRVSTNKRRHRTKSVDQSQRSQRWAKGNIGMSEWGPVGAPGLTVQALNTCALSIHKCTYMWPLGTTEIFVNIWKGTDVMGFTGDIVWDSARPADISGVVSSLI